MGRWMRCEFWWRWGLRWMHLLLMDGDHLHMVAWRGHVAVVTTLVELGADIGALGGSGETPLQLSIR